MPIRGIALDAEGVMFDFERDGHHLAHRKVAADLGVTLSDIEALEAIPNLVGGPGKLIAKQIHNLVTERLGSCSLTPEEIEAKSRKYFKELFLKMASGEVKIEPRPGLHGAICFFRSINIPVVVGSSTWPEEFWIYWFRTGLKGAFPSLQVVLASEENGIRHKPEPDIFLRTAELMGIGPKEQLIFEDSQRGVVAGVAAGSTVIGMTTYDHPREIIRLYEAGAKRVFSDWREVNLRSLIDNLNSRK
ncbi:MAG: phosphorylated carbohydrates phosphatase TM1254-like [Parcubacteria group bacterium Gr01-1014_20]|nr:MAG: phosphorylated carbohydrates phosphatase TM1254-like [Parcubacteria group bacterium Gr01-1014_20]